MVVVKAVRVAVRVVEKVGVVVVEAVRVVAVHHIHIRPLPFLNCDNVQHDMNCDL